MWNGESKALCFSRLFALFVGKGFCGLKADAHRYAVPLQLPLTFSLFHFFPFPKAPLLTKEGWQSRSKSGLTGWFSLSPTKNPVASFTPLGMPSWGPRSAPGSELFHSFTFPNPVATAPGSDLFPFLSAIPPSRSPSPCGQRFRGDTSLRPWRVVRQTRRVSLRG